MAATGYTGTRIGDRLSARTSGDTLEGLAGNDILNSGTTSLSGVWLSGGDGNDTLIAKTVDALIDGGAGIDTVQFSTAVAAVDLTDAKLVGVEKVLLVNTSSAGYDFSVQREGLEITGTRVADDITGGAGNDTITGALGVDTLRGGDGDDVLVAESTDALISGGAGADTVRFAAAVTRSSSGVAQLLDADLVDADNRLNIVITHTGNAVYDFADQSELLNITGGRGKDTITGGQAADTLSGGNGNDLLIASVNDGLIDGGAGIDTVRYGANADISALDDAELLNVEYVVITDLDGGSYDFSSQTEGLDITATGSADTVKGGSGADVLRGGLGDDRLYAGDNDRLIDGGNGTDTAWFATGVSARSLMDVDLINVERVTIEGAGAYDFSAQSEKLVISAAGATGAVTLTGGKGTDTLTGGAGDDVIVASDLDVIDGGAGNNTVRFAAGVLSANLEDGDLENIRHIVITNTKPAVYDFSAQAGEAFDISGSASNDAIVTATGTIDTISGGAGNDVLVAEDTDALIDGGAGSDTVRFGAAVLTTNLADLDLVNVEYVLITNTGHAIYDFSAQTESLQITGNAGDDTIYGGYRADTITGGAGADSLYGNAGADLLVADDDDAVIDGGAGDDTVRFAAAVTTSHSASWLVGVENVVITNTGSGRYDFSGQANALSISSSSGNDTLTGGDAADTLSGGAGDDVLVAQGTDALLDGGAGTDTVRFGADVTTALTNVRLVNVERVEITDTGTGTYDFSVQTEALTIVGNAGADTITGGSGNDSISGEGGADSLSGGAGSDTLVGSTGNDTLSGGEGVDSLLAGEGDDILVAQDIDAKIDGGPNGDVHAGYGDTVWFAAGVTALNLTDAKLVGIERVKITNSSAGSYDFSAQTEALTITGGGANDTIVGTQEWDLIEGGNGNDMLTGGAGSDVFRVSAGSDTIADLFTGDVLIVSAGATATAIDVTAFVATAATANAGTAIINAAAVGSLIDLSRETGSVGYMVNGGAGVDVVTGSVHDDTLAGGAGADSLVGGLGADLFLIAAGEHDASETVTGDDGTDVIRFTSTSAQTLTLSSHVSGVEEARIATAAGLASGATAENIDASSAVGAIALYGNDGANILTGNASANVIVGGDGADTITGGAGADEMDGGAGADAFVIAVGDAAPGETIRGGTGTDVIYFTSTSAQTLTFSNVSDVEEARIATATGLASGTTAENIDALTAVGAIALYGNDGANILTGNASANVIVGGDGADTITGGAGADSLAGGLGADLFLIAAGEHDASETVTGGDGTDVIRFTSTSAQTLTLSSHVSGVEEARIATAAGLASGTTAENIDASSAVGAIALYGNDGANILTGNASANVIEGGVGDDILTGGAGSDSLVGGEGNDTFVYDSAVADETGAGVETIAGGNGTDTIVVAGGTTGVNFSTDTITDVETLELSTTADAQTVTMLDAQVDALSNINADGDQIVLADVMTSDMLNGTVVNGTLTIQVNNVAGNALTLVDGVMDDAADLLKVEASGLTGTNALTFEGLAETTARVSVAGGAGNDVVKGTNTTTQADTLVGGAGNDEITGGAGADSLVGGEGNDTFVVTTSSDLAAAEVVEGGANTGGVDTLRLDGAGAFSNTQLDGTLSGVEVVSLNNDSADWSLTLAAAAFTNADIDGNGTADETIRVSAVSALTNDVWVDASAAAATSELVVDGTNLGGNDTLTGGAGNDTIGGGAGNDSLTGGAGADSLVGGEGSDTFVYNSAVADETGAGVETIAGGNGTDTIVVAGGTTGVNFSTDTISGVETLELSTTADAQTVTMLDAQVDALSNINADGDQIVLADVMTSDMLDGTVVNGTLTIQVKNVAGNALTLVDGVMNDAADLLKVEASGLTGANALTFVGLAETTARVSVAGGAGNDVVKGTNTTTQADTLVGGAGNDEITGGAGADSLVGGEGDDVFRFASGAELNDDATVIGGNGTDTIEITAADTGLVDADFDHVNGVEVLTLTGASAAVLAAYASTAGIASVNTGAANTALTSTMSAVLSVNAEALADGQLLTLSGTGDVTVNNLLADLTSTSTGTVAVTLDDDAASGMNATITNNASSGTLTVNSGEFDSNDTIVLAGSAVIAVVATDSVAITTGTANASVSEVTGQTATVNATAMSDGGTLTLSGAGGFTVTGLQADLSSSADGGALSVTTADVATQTIALGSGTTGTRTVNATAMTDGDALTLSGAGALTLSSGDADVIASAYTGAITATVTNAAASSFEIGTAATGITAGGSATLTIDADAGGSTAGALTLAGAATGDVAVTGAESTVTLADGFTGTGLVSVTTADVAALTVALGTSTTGTRTVNATAMTDGDVLTLTGSDALTLSSGDADVNAAAYTGAITATVTGTAAAAYSLGTTSSSLASSNSGGLSVNAEALADGQVLTLSGTGDVTVNNLLADLTSTSTGTVAVTLDDDGISSKNATITNNASSGTLTVNSGEFDSNDTIVLAGSAVIAVVATDSVAITTGAANASVSEVTGQTATINATAMSDGGTLTLSGAGGFTVTGLQADLSSTAAGGAVSITTADVATQTIALGSGTTGTRTVDATAMTDGDALTLTGSGALTLSSDDADVNAASYTGAITATVTGTAAAVYTLGTTSSSLASSNSGGLSVNAEALADGQLLTLSGTGNVTVNNLLADLTSTLTGTVAVTLDDDAASGMNATITNSASSGTLTVNSGEFDGDDTITLAGTRAMAVVATDSVAITTGAANASVSEVTGQTATINATAMADGGTLTLSGAGGFTVTGLQADLSSSADGGALSVTTADVATQTIALGSGTTGTRTVDATAMTDGDMLTLTGSGALTLSSDEADVNAASYTGAITATVTGTAAAAYSLGTTSSSLASSNSGGLSVNAEALADGQVLTLSGTGDVTVNNLLADLTSTSTGTVAVTLDDDGISSKNATITNNASSGTLTVNSGEFDSNDTIVLAGSAVIAVVATDSVTITTGAANASVSEVTGQTATINATAMADINTLTISGEGNFTITGLQADLTSTAAGGAVNITTTDVLTQTIALGSGTTGTRTVNATAMTDGDALTLSGAGALTLSSGDADVDAAAYTGAITATVTNAAASSFEIGTAATGITAGGSATLTIDADAGGSTAGALTLAGTATGDVAVTGAESTVTLADGFTGTGLVSVTTADVAALMVALGTSTSGSRAVNATAMTDSDVLTLTGSDALTLSSGDADVDAAAYTGAITATVTNTADATLQIGTANATVTAAGNDAAKTLTIDAAANTANTLTIADAGAKAGDITVSNAKSTVTLAEAFTGTGDVTVVTADDAAVAVNFGASTTGTRTVNATAMTDGDMLTLTGSDALTLSSGDADVDAAAYTGAITATVTNTADATLQIGTANATVTAAGNDAAKTLTIDAAANTANTLTIADADAGAKAGDITVSNAKSTVTLADAFTGTGDVTVVTADDAAVAVNFGASTTGTRTVNATAMTDGDMLTLTGSDALTLSSDDADVDAAAYTGAITATVTNAAASSFEIGTAATGITAGGSATLTIDADAGGSTAGALTLAGTATGDVAVTGAESTVTLADGFTGTGLVSVTTADVAALTVALGTSTTGTRTVNATAMTDGDVLTLTGSDALTLSSDDADVDAAAYTGAITATVTNAAASSFEIGTAATGITAGGSATLTIDADAGGSTAGALTLAGTATGNVAVTGAESTVTLADGFTGTGLVSVTTADVAALTVALGTSTTGTRTVNATAMTDGDMLTLTGSGALTLSSGDADVNASAYTGAITATVTNAAASSFEIGTAATGITAGGSATLTIDADAGGSTAGALTLAGTATGNVVVMGAESTVTLADGFTGTGLVSVTTADVAALTVALGTSTTGTRTVNAMAMTDGDVLTLTGSDDASVTLVGGDLAAGSYVGKLTVIATTGTNAITTGSGNDTITGDTGNDTITGGAGADSLNAGDGDDFLVFNTGDVQAGEQIDGGNDNGDVILVNTSTDFSLLGTATLKTAGHIEQIRVTSGQSGTFTGSQLTGQALYVNATSTAAATLNIEVASGSTVDFSSMLFGSSYSGDAFTSGTDVININGASGNENITGTSIADTITGGAGADTLTGGAGVDNLSGGADANVYRYGAGEFVAAETLTGGTGSDTVVFTADSQTVADAAFANKTLLEAITLGNGVNSLTLGTTAAGATAGLTVTGGTGADTIDASALGEVVTINAGNGNNVMTGSSAADTLTAGSGDDIFTGGWGSDSLDGGAGNDTFRFASGDELGYDALVYGGGSGADTIEITASAIDIDDADFVNVASVQTLALTGASTAVLGLEAGAGGLTTVDTGTGATSITATVLAALTVKSDVADGSLLTLAGDDVNFTVTGLVGDLTVSDAHSGSVAVTLGSVANTTVAFGTNTTGTHSVNANALTDGQVLTLTGSDDASVTLVDGDLAVGSYVGKLTVNAGSGSNVITTGSGNDTITGGAGMDNLSAGSGDDIIQIVAGGDAMTGAQTETINGGDGTDALWLQAGGGTYLFSSFSNNYITNVEVIRFAPSPSQTSNVGAHLDNDMAATSDFGGTNSGTVRVEASGLNFAYGVAVDASDFSTTSELVVDGTNFGGADTMIGGAGNDTITGGAGVDILSGGGGDDTFKIAALADIDGLAEQIFGGTSSADAGTDNLTFDMAGAANLSSATLSGIETLNLHADSNAITLTVGQHAAFSTVNAAGSADSFTLSGDGAVTTKSAVETYAIGDDSSNSRVVTVSAAGQRVTASSTSDAVTFDLGMLTYTGTLTGDVTTDDQLRLGTGASIAGATLNGIEALELVSGASVTMTAAQYAGFTGTVTAAGSERIILTTALTGAAILNAAVEAFTLAAGANSVTSGASSQSINADALLDTQVLTLAGSHDVTVSLINGDLTATSSGKLTVNAGSGSNVITTGSGNDTITGGAGNDVFNANGGTMTVTDLTTGDALVVGASGTAVANSVSAFVATSATVNNGTDAGKATLNAAVAGSTIDVSLAGNAKGFNLVGNTGVDTFTGTTNADSLSGDGGADVITGNGGADSLNGGANNDILVFASAANLAAAATVIGGDNTDTVRIDSGADAFTAIDADFTDVSTVETLALNGTGLQTLTLGTEASQAFHVGLTVTTQAAAAGLVLNGAAMTKSMDVTGTNSADTLTGGNQNDALKGGSGADVITGSAGSDNLQGGVGTDTFVYGVASELSAAEAIDGGADVDTIRLDAGGTYDFTAASVSSVEQVSINANAAMSVKLKDNFNNDNGNVEVINGTGSAITADLTIDASAFTGGTAALKVSATNFDGNDTFIGTANADTITGGAGADTLTGGNGVDSLDGGAGDDVFRFASGAELNDDATVIGGSESDTIEITAAATDIDDIDFTDVDSVETLALTDASTAVLGLEAGAGGLTTVDTGTGATSITATVLAALTVKSDVADGSLLTLAGDTVNFTVTGLVGDLTVSDAHSGNVAVTLGSVANTTVAFGTNTTGTHSVNADALTDGQVLTLTGSDAASVTLAAGDLTAGAYTGNLTVTATDTTGVNAITTGSGNDTITGGGGADVIDGGDGNDVFRYINTVEINQSQTVVGGNGSDTIAFTAAFDSTSETNANFSTTVGRISSIEIVELFGASTLNLSQAVIDDGLDTIRTGNDSTALRVDSWTSGTWTVDTLALADDKTLRIYEFGTLTSGHWFDVFNLKGNLDATSIRGSVSVTAASGTDFAVLMSSGSGNDTLTGGLGSDSLNGGDGNDTFRFASGAELNADVTVIGGNGADTIEITTAAIDIDDTDFIDVALVETLALTGASTAVLGLEAGAGGLTTVDTGTGATSITATVLAALTVKSDVADGSLLTLAGDDVNFTVTGLVGDLTVSDTHSGSVAVTLGSVANTTVAFGTNTTGTHSVNADAMIDGQVLTLTGSDALTLSSGDADVIASAYTGAITATVTGTAAAAYSLGTTSSSLASSNSGGLSVNAEALADGQLLTLSGTGDVTVNNLLADLTSTSTGTVAVTLDDDAASGMNATITNNASSGTLTVNSGEFDSNDTIVLAGSAVIAVVATDSVAITTGTANASVSEVTGQTATINATAMADINTLTISGEGNFTITGLQADLTSTAAGGAVNITTTDVLTQTIALGSGTTGTRTVNATAMTDGDALTLSGAGALTLSSGDADVIASAYTGAITATVTNAADAALQIGTANATVTAAGDDAAKTLTIDAAANTASTLTIADAGAKAGDITVSNAKSTVTLADAFQGTGDVTVVTADDAAVAVNFGASTSGTRTVNAMAMTDGDQLTLTGSDDASVTLVDGDLAAGSYVGKLTVNAGSGSNVIITGSGNDTITGNGGADSLNGGANNDILVFASAANLAAAATVIGGDNTDTVRIDSGADAFTATDADFTDVSTVETLALNGTGLQTLTLGTEASEAFGVGLTITTQATATGLVLDGAAMTRSMDVTGTNNADQLTGGNQNDALKGGSGADVITGSAGSDNLQGGAGTDTFVYGAASELSAAEAIDGGADVDTIRLDAGGTYDFTTVTTSVSNVEQVSINANAAMTVKLKDNFNNDNGNVEVINGTGSAITADLTIDASAFTGGTAALKVSATNFDGNDTFIGTANADTITGGAGADTIRGGNGSDTITGGAGDDVYVYTGTVDVAAAETITEAVGGGTADRIRVDGSTDFTTVTAAGNFDEIEQLEISGAFTATFTGAQLTGETVSLIGNTGGVQALVVTATAGATTNLSTISAGTNWTAGTDTVTINGADGTGETIIGTATADIINGGTGADVLTGGTGVDTFYTAGTSTPTFGGAGDSGTVSGYDTITTGDFALAGGDKLEVAGTPVVAANGTLTTDSALTISGAVISSILITSGAVVFSAANDGSSPISIDSAAKLAAAIQALTLNDIGSGGDTTYFTATIDTVSHTYVYTQSTINAGGDIVDLVGVTGTSLMTTGTTAGGILLI